MAALSIQERKRLRQIGHALKPCGDAWRSRFD